MTEAKTYTDDELRAIRGEIDKRLGDRPGEAPISAEDNALLDRAGALSDAELELLRKRLARP